MSKKLLALISSLAALAAIFSMACSGSSPTEASEENFEKIINEYLQKEGIYIAVARKFPIEVELERNIKPKKTRANPSGMEPLKRKPFKNRPVPKEKWDALEKKGILTSKQIVIEKDKYGYDTYKIKKKRYEISEKAKDMFRPPDEFNPRSRYSLLLATAKVDKINSFTAPTAIKGVTVCYVNYTYSPDKIRDWAKGDMEKYFPGFKDKLEKGKTAKAALILMNTGWVHSDYSNLY